MIKKKPEKFITFAKNFSSKNIINLKITNEILKNRGRYIKDKLLKKLSSFKTKSTRLIQTNFENLQDKIEQSVSSENEEVLLKQSPFWARSITWSLIGGTFLGIGWLSVAKTEEIIVVQGQLEPIKRVIDVQIPIGGIIKELNISEGDTVNKGQLLMKLDNEASKSRVKSLREILELNKSILESLFNLQKEGAVSKVQYLQQKVKVTEIENQLIDASVLLKNQNITAPMNGKIFDLKPKIKGFVAQTSQPILKIVPNDNLRAKVEIQSSSIGFVSKGKLVDISIDSFPASDFGVITGKVQSLGSDALPPDPSQGKGYRFPAIISLDSQVLKLKSGKELPLNAGMSLTANIKLRKVTYLQLLLGTFQDKADSLRAM